MQIQQKNQSHLTARIFDFISMNPSRILHTSYNQSKNILSVSRQKYSQLYRVHIDKDNQPQIQLIMTLQPSQQIYYIDGAIVLIMQMQMKVSFNGKWTIFPFTTQLIPLSSYFDDKKQRLYTFHSNQTRQWNISQDDGVQIKYVKPTQIPYHVNTQGNIEGFGKKLNSNNKNKFTICRNNNNGFLFIGSTDGNLQVYQTAYFTHVKTFSGCLSGAILTIQATQNVVYFSGSDSKVCAIVYNNQQWVLSNPSVRGQSHDIFSLSLITFGSKKWLVSGGITTDLCFYTINNFNSFVQKQWVNRISYPSQKLSQLIDQYIIVNNYNNFQIWKLSTFQPKSKQGVQLLVKYDLPFYKSIKQILVKKQQSSVLLFVITQQEASLWSFDQNQGLNKKLTVKNNYNISSWFKRDYIVTIRDGYKLQIFNYKNGNIIQLGHTQVFFPSNINILQQKDCNKLILVSKLQKQIQIYKFNLKTSKLLAQTTMKQQFEIADFCYYNSNNLMIKNSNSSVIQQYDTNGLKIKDILNLPFSKTRDYGWVPLISQNKTKVFWYVATEGKIAIVSKMKTDTQAQKRKIRIKQMPRIGSVVSNTIKINKNGQNNNSFDWDLGIIPLNFSKMISQQIQPIIGKKII